MFSSAASAQVPPGNPPPQSLRLTLDSAITLALEQNRDVKIAESDRSRADEQVREARSGAFPQLTLSGSYTRNIKKPVLFLPPHSAINPTDQTATFELGSDNAYTAAVTLSQALFNWKVGLAMDIASTYHEYAQESFRATVDNVVMAVKQSFYGVLLTRELVQANRQGLEIVRANAENVQAQFRNGTAAEFDKLRAEVQLANTEPLVISAENNYLLAVNGLKNLLGLPLVTDVDVVGELTYEEIPGDILEAARGEALRTNPMIASLVFQESMMEKNIGVERANYFPVLSLVGQYAFQTQDNTFKFNNYLWARSFNLGLQISFPLFDGFRTSARTEEASLDHQKVRNTRLKAEEGLRLQIQGTELRMKEAKERITAQEKTVAQAEKAVKIAQTRYANGVGTQLEMLDAQVALTRTRVNYAMAMYDFQNARAQWSNAVGRAR
jgi:outer membrane protein TolC